MKWNELNSCTVSLCKLSEIGESDSFRGRVCRRKKIALWVGRPHGKHGINLYS